MRWLLSIVFFISLAAAAQQLDKTSYKFGKILALVFQSLQPGSIGYFHATVFRFQLVESRRTEPVPAANLGRRHPSLLLFDHPDNLRLGETALSHSSAPSKVGQTLHHCEGVSGGQVTTRAT